LRQLISKYKAKEAKENKENPQKLSQINSKILSENIINIFEKFETELDKRKEQGAIDFKLLIIELYYQLLFKTKEKEISKKFFKLINKYLKNEVEDIGIKIYKYLLALVNVHYGSIVELSIKGFTELLVYINDNTKRVAEIWKININNDKQDKNLIKNSIELLGYYSYALLCNFANYNNYITSHNSQEDYLIEARNQKNNLLECVKKAINSIKIIEKENLNSNYKNFVLEKYSFFLIQMLYLFYILKSRNINKEEIELICHTFQFILKNTTIILTCQFSMKYFEDILKSSSRNNLPNGEINHFSEELKKNWKDYFNENNYLQNKYKSDNKYNLVLKNVIKYYLYCFNKQVNSEPISLFKEISNYMINDDHLKMFKNLTAKINDFRISIDIKAQILFLILSFCEWSTKENHNITLDILYFFIKQMTSFYHTLFSLSNEYISFPLRDEKQQQKEILQKNMLKINIEENDYNSIKKNNLNSLFLLLLSNKYDKYIYIEDQKQLQEFLRNSLIVLKKLIEELKKMLTNKEYTDYAEIRCYMINKIAAQLSKFFYYFFFIFEKTRINHQNHDNTSDLIDKLLEIYIYSFPNNDLHLFSVIFKRLMPFIFKLYKLGCKICPNKNCISTRLIHNIFKNIRDSKIRETLFKIYLEYFSLKIYETGNPIELFNSESNSPFNTSITLSESINNITILKSIFFNLLDCVHDIEYYKNKIIPLIIDFLHLSKGSEYYGNYIYILRCLFKYLKTAITAAQNPSGNDRAEKSQKLKLSNDFNIEINYILYAIIKYLVNIKEKTPFLSDLISEIIMTMPVKFKFLSEIPHLIFPSLVDSLCNGSENIQLNLINLENWMNIYVKHPENVVPFIQQNLTKIADSLSGNLLRPSNINVCLTSLKWLSKLGGKGRNYLKKKKINTKTCPTQILTMKLKEKNSNRTLDFILDNIIDIDVDNSINWSNKTFHKKSVTSSDKKIIYNYIEIYKNCLVAFFNRKIDYEYMIEVKKSIIEGINFNEEEFSLGHSFKTMNEKNSKIKINSLFRKKEHFIIGKIITGFFLINSAYISIQNNQKDQIFQGNNLMKFISDYFLMILLSKEKNNKNMLLFEIDPIMFIDEMIQFLFNSNPTIIRNTNVQLTDYSLKIINNIIDSINSFFDNDIKIIKNLEIVDIIYMKFINCCYVNESLRKDSGLMLLKILLQKFDKIINFKYLKYFFKCITSAICQYPNIIKIQFKKSSNILVEVIDSLINMFAINDENYCKLNEEDLKENLDNKKDGNTLLDKEKEVIFNAKNNFIMLFDFIRYSFDEIIEKIDIQNDYTRNFGDYLLNKIIGKIPQFKKMLPILFQIDINNITLIEFYKYFMQVNINLDYRQIISNCNNNISNNEINMVNSNNLILPNFNSTKIYKKLGIIFNALTKRLGLRDKAFSNLIAYSDSLINIFRHCPILIEEYIFSEKNKNMNLYLAVIKSLYFNILISYFNYCEISIYFKGANQFKTKLIYLFMEQLLVERNLKYSYKIKESNGKEITIENEVKEEYIEFIEKYIYEHEIYKNEVDIRNYLIGELFENLGLRINMVSKYINLLNDLFNKLNFNECSQKEREEISIYKKKTAKLIFIQIFNLNSATIIKQSKRFLYDTFKNDNNLRDKIYEENYNKINNLIEKINENEIRESNCSINQDIITGLNIDLINALLIICKTMKLDDKMTTILVNKIFVFDKIPPDKNEKNQFILFYGYISLFLYIDNIKEDILNIIFKQLLNRIKDIIIYHPINLLNFNQTKYHYQIIKLITKYRQNFSRFILNYICNKTKNRIEQKSVFILIKLLVGDDKKALICETLFIEIMNKIKNEIIVDKDIKEIKENLEILVYLLKLCKIISIYSPIYLKRTLLLEIIDDYIKRIIIDYDKNYEILQENIYYDKAMKYWLDLNKIYIENFKDQNKCLLSLFFFKSMKNVSNIEKNKIVIFVTYRLSINASDKNAEKKFKSIMNEFIKLDNETIKYFDLFVEYLIIPMMIRYLKNNNFFKYFSVSFNKDNSVKIDKADKKEDVNNNFNNGIKYDEEFLLNLLEKLSLRLYDIKFDTEKKEEMKYKLISLLIIVYLEYLNKKDGNKDYNDQTRNIFYTIQNILSHSPYLKDKEGLGLWRIYLLLDICLFSEREAKENNIKNISNFYKNLNEDYSNIEIIAYELIFPFSQTDNALEQLIIYYNSEGNISGTFNLLKIILKFPNIINKAKDSTIIFLLNFIYDISSKLSKNNVVHRKILVQSLGLIVSYISNQREMFNKGDKENMKCKSISDLDNAAFNVGLKLYKILFFSNSSNDKNEDDNFEILKKLIVYFREILNSSNDFQMVIPLVDQKSIDSIRNIHIHIQLLRIYVFNVKIDSIYKNIDLYFKIYKVLNDNNVNYRIFNDFAFVFRLLNDDKLLIQLNSKEKPNEKCFIAHKLLMLDYIEVLIKDMNKKCTNYDIKDLFVGYNKSIEKPSIFHENIIKRMITYLVTNKLYTDRNQNIYENRIPITTSTAVNEAPQSNSNNQQQQQQAQQTIQFQQQQMRSNPANNQFQQQSINDKWLETFHINDFKYFIFIRKLVEDFYSNNNTNISLEDNVLKEKLEKRLKSSRENLDNIHSITYSFFENFYCFTLFFLREYKTQYEIYYKKGYLNYLNIINKDIREYFVTSHNFYFNLRDFEDLKKIKSEQIECILHDKEKEKEKNKIVISINNMLIVYPDIILSGFLFFFQCDEIVEKYYYILLELFFHLYKFFRDKFYDPLLEHLLSKIMDNKILKDKTEEKNRFMFKILNCLEVLNTFKLIRTNENILELFIYYLRSNLNSPNFNKNDPNVIKSLRILLFNSSKLELQNRKNIFELIKSYIGYNLIDSLKWIFTFDIDEEDFVYPLIYCESIPLSIDFLLSHFQEGESLNININNFSKYKALKKYDDNNEDNKSMEIENNKNNEIYDKNSFIKNMVDNCNLITKKKKYDELLDLIRVNILSDNAFCYKIFVIIFSQIWKILTMNERETLTIYINELLSKYLEKQKDKNNQIINLLFETFSQCSPLIYIKPIIMQSLIPYQNFWSTNILYLENLLMSGIDIPTSYNSLINIFYQLKENELCNGLNYYFSNNKNSKEAFSDLQSNNFINAENIYYECFNKFKSEILDKINIDFINFDSTNGNIISNEEFDIFNDLSSWENGLIECYQNNNKWENIIKLSDINNNNDLKLNGLWYYGNEKWKDLDSFVTNVQQYIKPEKYNLRNPYIVQINDIYKIFTNEQNIKNMNSDNKYQNTCMNCIKTIYQDFSIFHPKNLENIDYYFFLIFQLAVEAWESNNTLHETLKKINEVSKCNFKDNLLLWRERLPHYCEGFKSLKAVLEPRNYLFKTLKKLLESNNDLNYSNYTDKIWTDMIYMKYSRKLNLVETFYDKLKIFEEENDQYIKTYPYEIYCKDIEYIKFIRNNIHNYDLGIKVCNDYINNFTSIRDDKNKDFYSYVINNFKEHKAYFYYKKGNILEAHKLFTESSIYKNKESTDYHLYYDWSEMCENISYLTKEEEESTEWFENTIHNFLYTIIYKLDKAKYIIPRMITFIKEFKNETLKNRFNDEISEIPPWIWIFWLPTLFENFINYRKDDSKNDFFFVILKQIALKYKQIFYYPYSIHEEKVKSDSSPINAKFKELKNIIYSENKYDYCIDKMQVIINELTKKEKENMENSLNSILSLCEMYTFKNQKMSEVKILFENVAKVLKNYPGLTQFRNNIEELMKNSEVTRNKLRECVIKNKYYLHNLIVTENKYKKLIELCEEKIHNIDFSNIELPGYFNNKIEEPTENNIIYISKFESEYSHKFITDPRPKVLIKCSNDKLYNFIIVNQDAEKNIDMKIYMMQILFNSIFAKNYQTYKRKVCFITPIKYHISPKIKIVEEDIYNKYNMEEIYEYCLQKRGYSPKISNQIFEEEAQKWNVNTDLVYYSSENNEKLFYKMCKIIPQDSLKNFIHKFILTSEDILLFRKQFTVSYSINNLLSFIFSDNILLKDISFRKENGFCSFNSDLTLFTDNEYKEIIEQKDGTPLRLTKNISFFMSITSIYGIIPGIFYSSCEALLNKPKILKSILKLSLDNNNDNNSSKIDKIVNNYTNKFKFILNLYEDNNQNIQKMKSDTFIGKENQNEIRDSRNNYNDDDNKENKNNDTKRSSMKIIYELINNSMNNNNLKKKTIDYEAWF